MVSCFFERGKAQQLPKPPMHTTVHDLMRTEFRTVKTGSCMCIWSVPSWMRGEKSEMHRDPNVLSSRTLGASNATKDLGPPVFRDIYIGPTVF